MWQQRAKDAEYKLVQVWGLDWRHGGTVSRVLPPQHVSSVPGMLCTSEYKLMQVWACGVKYGAGEVWRCALGFSVEVWSVCAVETA